MKGEDFIVTIHALERMEQRFGDVVSQMSDREVAHLIHEEVMNALDEGRQAKLPPLELAPFGPDRWIAMRKGNTVVWNKDRRRGYVISDQGDLLVLTVLRGEDRSRKQALLRGQMK